MHKTNTLFYFFNQYILEDSCTAEYSSLEEVDCKAGPSQYSIKNILAYADAASKVKPSSVKELDLILN